MTEEKKNEVKAQDEVKFEVQGEEVKLSSGIVAQFITKGDAQISRSEAVNFINLCRYAKLNPFLGEAFLIKYSDTKPAEMVVSKEAFMKRAHREPTFDGYEAGVIVEDKEGEEIFKKGQYVGSKNKLVGGWAEVYRSDMDRPFHVAVALSEYHKGQSTWNKMPANMIRKVALVNALREAFPEALGAMYTEEEPGKEYFDDDKVVKPAEFVEVENEILGDFSLPEEEEKEEVKEKTKGLPGKTIAEEYKELKGKEKTVDEELEELMKMKDEPVERKTAEKVVERISKENNYDKRKKKLDDAKKEAEKEKKRPRKTAEKVEEPEEKEGEGFDGEQGSLFKGGSIQPDTE